MIATLVFAVLVTIATAVFAVALLSASSAVRALRPVPVPVRSRRPRRR
jgi:hypothetical protein